MAEYSLLQRQQQLVPLDHEMMVYQNMAKQATESKLYRGIGDQAAVMTIMLAAREMGIPPMSALNGGLNIIKGKVEVSARMMNAMIRRAGHNLTVKEISDEKCVVRGRRGDNGDEMEASFSMEDARRADLLKGGSGWQKFPQDMLFARAMSRLARRLFSDVIGMAYVEGEISGETAPYNAEAEIRDCASNAPDDQPFWEEYKDAKPEMQKYIQLLQEKYDVQMEQVLKRWSDNPQEFRKKFETWQKISLKNQVQ